VKKSNKNKETFDFEEYFDPNIFPSPPDEYFISDNLDQQSLQEKDSLFKGPLNDVESWIKHEEFRLKKLNQDSERELREDNAKKAFRFSSIWAGLIGFIILARSFFPTFFVMNENEYMATIGTLSITILTYYLVVIKYLFSRKGD